MEKKLGFAKRRAELSESAARARCGHNFIVFIVFLSFVKIVR
jgi:hypothetical protein